jgi:hypothetical protein
VLCRHNGPFIIDIPILLDSFRAIKGFSQFWWYEDAAYLATLREQRRQVFRVTFAGAPREREDLKELVKCLCQRQGWRNVCIHGLLHLMRNIMYTVVEIQRSVLAVDWQAIALNGTISCDNHLVTYF